MGIRCHVDTAHVVDSARLLLELLACRVNLRLRLADRQLLREIGGANRAQIRLDVPTDLAANPVTAVPALSKIRTGFLNRLSQRCIMELPADHPLDFVYRGSGSTPATQEITRNIQQRLGYTDGRCLKLRHVAIAALVTMEFELIPTVRGQIVVVMDELNERHVLTIVAGWIYVTLPV